MPRAQNFEREHMLQARECDLSLDFSVWIGIGTPFAHFVRTLFLLRRQSAPHHEQVGQSGGGLEAVQIFRQASIADLLEANHPSDHPDRVPDLCAHARFNAVLGLMASSTRLP
jgi:hypothetical protein